MPLLAITALIIYITAKDDGLQGWANDNRNQLHLIIFFTVIIIIINFPETV